jgi:WD40 repeat protein
VFHPTRSIFFISTKKTVRVYDLREQKLIKKLETGLREVSSIAVHPGGMFPFLFLDYIACFIVGMNANVIRLVFHFAFIF